MSMQGWKRLAVTSPGPGCGKSTVTMNLAFALARQPDIRTLVIDLDLRRPIYKQTAAYGHFGRPADGDFFPWERTDLVEDLKAAVGK